jgi:UDP-4-keto-D-QuiNAc 4-reductase
MREAGKGRPSGRVLVTGASGFVGQHLLCRLEPHSVRIARRRPSQDPLPSVESVVTGEIGPNTDWAAALAGVDCVVHLAARVHVMRPSAADTERFVETNVLGSQRLAEAAAAGGVRRFVFLSSVKVNGEETVTAPFTARDTPAPVDDYGVSKWRAEEALLSVASRTGMEVTIIRPPLVYGPGVRANFLRLMDAVRRGAPLPLGLVHNSRSMVSVWNLVDLIATALSAPQVGARVFMASDGHDLSTPELIRRIARQMQKPALLLPVPPAMLHLAGRLSGRRDEIKRLCGSLAVDISETCRILDWSPPVTVDDAIARTVAWYRDSLRGAR